MTLFIYRMVTIFRFDHMIAENQQLNVESCVSQFYVSCLVTETFELFSHPVRGESNQS